MKHHKTKIGAMVLSIAVLTGVIAAESMQKHMSMEEMIMHHMDKDSHMTKKTMHKKVTHKKTMRKKVTHKKVMRKTKMHKKVTHKKVMHKTKMMHESHTMEKDMSKKMMKPPFGSKDDVSFAKMMWEKLHEKGYDALHNKLYVGGPPHGKVREVIEGIIDDHLVIAKTNYGGKDVTIDKVKANPKKYLKAVTVMVKRDGYDPDDQDWFWVKYKPDGTVLTNEKGMKLAGRVAKDKPVGCISCHQSASGSDFVFSHNKTVNADITWIGDIMKKEKFADLMK